MATEKDVRGYWCDKLYERIAVAKGKIQCEHYHKSDLQTWCSMGRCADNCRVVDDIRRGEKPESYADWLEDTIKAAKHAEERIRSANQILNSREFQQAIKRVCDFHAQIDSR